MEKSPKYKILGVINFLLGISQIGIPLIQLIFVYPKLRALYTDFNVKFNPILSFWPVVFLLLIGFLNLVLGVKLLKKSKDYKEGYFKLAVATTVVGLLLTLPLLGLNWVGFFSPLYSLKNSY